MLITVKHQYSTMPSPPMTSKPCLRKATYKRFMRNFPVSHASIISLQFKWLSASSTFFLQHLSFSFLNSRILTDYTLSLICLSENNAQILWCILVKCHTYHCEETFLVLFLFLVPCMMSSGIASVGPEQCDSSLFQLLK